MEKTKVLLVEDDPNLGNLLKEYLEAKGYTTTLATNGKLGYDVFSKDKFNICILDVMMPVKDGITLAKEIRAIDTTIPIVFLTAKSMKEDAIEGFKVGADDYITKPFSMEELLLRLQAILRRTDNKAVKNTDQTEFKIGKYKFDYQHQTLDLKGSQHKLTTKEAELLKLLCLHANDVLDRNFALKSIWNDDNYFNGRSMDVYIAKLRKYLKEDPNVELINVHGKGFKLLVGK
ncbi:MAG: response regulator transcription factor [Bacteroidia bacterium]|jgi:DNA-binding response OmpR family regulator|nr:response regulator transcription factor [Bacteroidia bacterium]